MSIRTVSSTMNRQSLLDLQRTNERLANNQTRISSGNRLVNPGDDPAAAASIMDLGNSIQANSQFLKQIDSATSYLSPTEDAVNAAVNANFRLQELAAGALGLPATDSAVGRASMVTEIDAIRTNLVSIANTQSQGKYLFAGKMTTTVPFTDAMPPVLPAYNGDQGSINLDVTATQSVATNIPGDQVFEKGGPASSSNFFQVLADLREGLTTNDTPKIQTASDNLNSVLDNLNQVLAELGGRQAGLSALKDTLSGFNVSLQGLQNTQQETDYPKAAVEYASDQTAQSATLSSMAKISKTNLFDYLA
jgi:flagellar hook-associated protein 3 FlgL